MNPKNFVAALSEIRLPGVFNPYSDKCSVHDLSDAPSVRRNNLKKHIESAQEQDADTIWMGRDLGYRGGRRTGLALTDEAHFSVFPSVFSGAVPARATKGPLVAERTAAEIWAVLTRIRHPPVLWNVFPLHPHAPDSPFTNRRFTAKELQRVTALNKELVSGFRIKRIICIGQDAAAYAEKLGVAVECVRHPSYGGVAEFRAGMQRLYGKEFRPLEKNPQLF